MALSFGGGWELLTVGGGWHVLMLGGMLCNERQAFYFQVLTALGGWWLVVGQQGLN